MFYSLAAYLSLTVFVYSLFYKLILEFWVITDSFQKSFKILQRMIDQQNVPIFIVQKNGRIMYTNTQGANIISSRYSKQRQQ